MPQPIRLPLTNHSTRPQGLHPLRHLDRLIHILQEGVPIRREQRAVGERCLQGYVLPDGQQRPRGMHIEQKGHKHVLGCGVVVVTESAVVAGEYFARNRCVGGWTGQGRRCDKLRFVVLFTLYTMHEV